MVDAARRGVLTRRIFVSSDLAASISAEASSEANIVYIRQIED
jgi:hypothetical protein